MRAVIVDIDGTLSDTTHRIHHVTGPNRDWGAFFAAMGDDPVHEPIRDVVGSLDRDFDILLCSGRPETYRDVTVEWLNRHGIEWARLYMRPADDTRPDHIVKAQLLRGMRKDGFEPYLVIDDRPTVVAMWREQGLTCLQCREWNERAPIAPGLLTIMVGPSGAGKTSWLNCETTAPRKVAGLHVEFDVTEFGVRPQHIVSSDQIREDICGDFRSQERNDDIFAAVHAITKARLRAGVPTVVDATNLRRKDRMEVAALAPDGGKVRYIVLDRPMDEKRRDAGWRAEVKDRDSQPFDLIGKHDATFRSQLRDILAGDGLPNVEVVDLRRV